jgi:anthranilate 1,2-dioxygenase large subunit
MLDHLPKKLARAWPREGFTRVPAWIYSDPELFDREMEAFFYGPSWCYVGLDCEVPEAGSFKRNWIGQKPVIVTRDEDGDISVLENRCAHRGTLVCWQNSGTTKDLICPYHQWRYDLRGTLRAIPFQRGVRGKGGMPAEFDRAQHGLRRLRVARRGGLIFATFSDATPELERYCGPELLAQLDRLFPGRPLRLIGYSRQVMPCNWKSYFENSRDAYHATLLHSFFISFGLYRADAPDPAVMTMEGGRHMANYSVRAEPKASDATMEMSSFRSGLRLHDPETVTARPELGNISVCGVQLFPSLFFQQHANALATRHIIPLGPQSVELGWTYYGYEDDDEAMRHLRLKHANLTGPAGYVSMDDSEVLAQVQEAVAGYPQSVGIIEMGGHGTESDSTMLTELGVRAFYQFYRAALGFD